MVDGSKESASAAEAAVDLANGSGSELHVVHVLSLKHEPPYPRGGTGRTRQAMLEARKLFALTLLDKYVEWIGSVGGRVAASHYREGRPEIEAVRLGDEIGASLVVVGDRKPDWLDRIFPKSLSERVLRLANRPVLVVREPPAGRPQKVPRRS